MLKCYHSVNMAQKFGIIYARSKIPANCLNFDGSAWQPPYVMSNFKHFRLLFDFLAFLTKPIQLTAEEEKIMNTLDFSSLNHHPVRLCGLLLLSLLASSALAQPPSPESFVRNELVLTLSDQWLPPANNNPMNSKNPADSQQNELGGKKRAVDVDCGMDVSPFASEDNSLSNRLVGECNLDYRY